MCSGLFAFTALLFVGGDHFIPPTERFMFCNCSASQNSNHSNASSSLQSARPLFRLGQVVATRAVLAHLEHHGIAADPYLKCHVSGDWGMVPPADAKANNLAVQHGARILSSYDIAGKRVWIITEADRSVTTLLFPEEY
jgi:hypothetical protein